MRLRSVQFLKGQTTGWHLGYRQGVRFTNQKYYDRIDFKGAQVLLDRREQYTIEDVLEVLESLKDGKR